MNIIVTACQVPFIGGGASYHVSGLVAALREAGHRVELLRLPFQFAPASAVRGVMTFAEQLDLSHPNGQPVDRVISLQFPGYGIQHPHHVVWLMHQYRAAYELFDQAGADSETIALRDAVLSFDDRALSRVQHRFANSPRVAERLRHYNGLDAEPLSHPPPFANLYRCAPAQPYIFCPSRLESLKRQDLLIEAAALMRSPVGIVIAGSGGQAARYRELAAARGVEGRVRFVGELSEREKIAFYAHALAVFFAPYDEDYGYVTLEAMLSGKPVITCTDSGGPLAYVEEGVTGRVLAPEPPVVAEAIDAMHRETARAANYGRAGREAYQALNLSWERTVDRLLSV
ncbi:glycosyltransferase family 4 protein [Chromatocurvus halotolerans]|uniref:Glycosyltransferase involved in cell wall biosynthesis n=1 Tax=Chromatocurvus halotolerans TaxID=1132028 RepID=A0A4R2KRZ4_9GAMM|nr:glycosyltransferase family 4 protein [Chromatocurvus halotolerans]TCO73759.1 glycosyltransferase involved in cell wall biosynthesis [Chromatocurvus halotolerans]